ncbi:calcium-binding protein [Alteromonas pelagimontana]|uniref:Calcium-binding protein n=1 Tax=Alteromonas pelagimontana TaxID=1858656 RepID=A0A6M4M9J7_9ALTE|nr:hypothetical protein [Alteromonas pelagimontana]QJR79831.1 calcium-binding protein [Alteromonas pelagimontana]
MKRVGKAFFLLFTSVAFEGVAIADTDSQSRLLKKLDVDQDGSISLKEAVSNTELLRNFSKIDKNKDGLLGADELAKSEFVKTLASES